MRGRRALSLGLAALALVAVSVVGAWQPWTAGSSAGPAPACPSPAGSPPGAAAANSPAVGVQFHATWSDYTDKDRARVLDQMAAAHLRWVRIDAGWRAHQPRDPRSWDESALGLLDRSVAMAHDRGLSVLVTLLDSPGWAGGGERRILPRNPPDYASAIAHLADRYKGTVSAWEVWNEPNSAAFTTKVDPAAYAALLRSAYPAVKASAPRALVVFGGTEYNDDSFLASVYAAGGGGFFDVMATHPYPSPSDQPLSAVDDGSVHSLGHVRAVREVLDRNGGRDLPIWFTEIGWSTHRDFWTKQPWARGVTRDQQADYVLRAVALVREQFPYVTQLYWYTDRDQREGDAQNDNYGLLTRDLTPKPALARLACELSRPE